MFKRITNNISNALGLKKRRGKTSMRLIYGIVGVLVVYYIYLSVCKNRKASYNAFYQEGFENKKTLVFFHMNGCGHCTKMMPEWHAFEKENNTGVATKKLERGQAGSLIEKHKIQGFPTIMLLDNNDNKIKDYSGPRTKSGLLEFCKNV